MLQAASHPSGDVNGKVAGTQRTVGECLTAFVDSGEPDDYEFVINCAAGSGDIAAFSKSLLASRFAKGSDDFMSSVREMVQKLMDITSGFISSHARAQPELLLLAATRLTGEKDGSAIPLAVKEAVQAFDQSEWRPLWWMMRPPSVEGTFDLESVHKLPKDFERMPLRAKHVKVPDDGSCMLRVCLAVELKEERWMERGVSKEELYQKLVDTGWDLKIKDAIKAAYAAASEVCAPSTAFAKKFSVEGLFDCTVANFNFNLYSPVGINSLMDGVDGAGEVDDSFFLETFADGIYQHILVTSGVNLLPMDGTDLAQFETGVWLKQTGVHYDAVVTEKFFPAKY
ncbi:hypothetical protein [Ottowia thiooxydans]|uniref:hypothetical protein n=1 Tax=Ottowia thiooxydans TaxID=219182 RepID=UPI0012EBEFAF|nr:hypothetical protein [Ottowia thiooxydans]